MAGPDNAKNELLELSAANQWPAPQFAYVPGDVNPFRCQVTQVVPMRAAPFVATGISCMTKKGCEKEAAAVMLAELAEFFAQQVGGCDGLMRATNFLPSRLRTKLHDRCNSYNNKRFHDIQSHK
jgi:hypothetical protein